MPGKRPKPEEIVTKLRQVEVLQRQGMPIADAVRYQNSRAFWRTYLAIGRGRDLGL